jgi:hypothetical protein
VGGKAGGISNFLAFAISQHILDPTGTSPVHIPCLRGHRRYSSQADDKRLRCLGKGISCCKVRARSVDCQPCRNVRSLRCRGCRAAEARVSNPAIRVDLLIPDVNALVHSTLEHYIHTTTHYWQSISAHSNISSVEWG